MGNERSSLCFYTPSHGSLHGSFLALSLWIAPGRTRDQSQGRDGVNNAGSAVPRQQHLRFVAPSQQNLGAGRSQEHVEGGMRSCPWARTQLETALRNISLGNISLLSQTAPKGSRTPGAADSPTAQWSHTRVQPER